MKRSTFAILFTILITFSCAFASCNARENILGQESPPTTEEPSQDITSVIKDLEDRIIEIKQDQYISESKRAEEILRLENLILELSKKPNTDTETDTDTDDTEINTDNSDNENEDTDTESGSNISEEQPVGKFLYTSENGEATITGYTGTDSVLTLPSSIDGYTVTRIADDAFTSESLQILVIPDGVTKIGWFAFRKCSSLQTVTVPDSVQSIGYSAFPQNVSGFTIICPADSFAAKYAQSYGISATLI